jgi:hypothetical protein
MVLIYAQTCATVIEAIAPHMELTKFCMIVAFPVIVSSKPMHKEAQVQSVLIEKQKSIQIQ